MFETFSHSPNVSCLGSRYKPLSAFVIMQYPDMHSSIMCRMGRPIALIAIAMAAAFVLMSAGCSDSDAAGGKIPNTDITWETSGDTLTITGPAGGQDMPEYDDNPNQPWSMDGIKKVVIGDGITRVGRSTFEDCSDVTHVTLGKDLREIGQSAFRHTGIGDLVIPDSVTTLEQEAFSGCDSLKTAHLGNGVQNIGFFAFMGCDNMESVNIPASVTTIDDDAFNNCLHLHRVDWYASFTVSHSDHVFSYDEYDPDGFDMYCGPGSVMTDGILDGACLKTLVFDGKSIRSGAFDMNSCITLDKFVFGNDLESIAGDAFDFYNFYDTNGKKIDPTLENLKGHSFVAKNWHEMYMESSGDDALEDDSESLKTPTIALTVLVAAMAFVMIVAFARKK